MIESLKFIVVYPLLTFNEHSPNNNVPYRPYTTTSMNTNYDIKVYEPVWNNIIKEQYEELIEKNQESND